ncbi:MAG: type IV toxin-antitoxin system AbiEi family antitoxin [Gammaproteobacteria bacterium]|nr:type IV toxin-antitoxin system AbiEi family antitoxin [Gammaproteobacteria bacterium]
MNRLATEHDILDAAIGAIHREAGLYLNVVGHDANRDDKRIDAIIQMPENGARLAAEIKKWATQANLGAVINQIKNFAEPGQGLLIADYINPNMGERLKEADVQFLDTAGNAYINQRPIYIYIKGNKPQQAVVAKERVKTGKAFQPTGMKVVFAFLRDRELINAPYREIADQAGVALGTVGWVIRDLMAQGILLEGTNKNQRELNNLDLLIDKWVEAYPYKLKGKYKIGTFNTDNPDWWKAIHPEEFDAWWGGETAVAKYTNYLNPKHGVVYIHQANMANFLQTARLRKTRPHERPDMQIDLIEPFWKEVENKGNTEQAGLAHPIIVYADLIETGDTRNLDAADQLRERYLR